MLKILKKNLCSVQMESKILDFGCGNGDFVQKLRQDGYNAYGCDLKFKQGKFADDLKKEGVISFINYAPYKLPYKDNEFDFIVSETVFEHVQNYEETIAELHRVLKPGGYSLHLFPAKYGIIESHVYVPFASVLQNYYYLLFWAFLGIRTKQQKGKTAKDVVVANKKYLSSSTNYLSTRQIHDAFSEKFSDVVFVEKDAIRYSPARVTQILRKMLIFIPFLSDLYRTFKSVAILTKKT